jgi:hypothetical protein
MQISNTFIELFFGLLVFFILMLILDYFNKLWSICSPLSISKDLTVSNSRASINKSKLMIIR